MRRNERVKTEVERTLGLLEQRIELEADPHFYAQLKRRINGLSRRKPARLPLFGLLEVKILRPVAVAALVLINIFSGMVLFSRDTGGYQHRELYLQAFAEEFSLTDRDSALLIEEREPSVARADSNNRTGRKQE